VLYENNRAAYLDVLGVAMDRAELDAAADLVWTYVLWSDLEQAGADPGDVDDLIDVLRATRDADTAALVKQQRDGRFKVSVRSRGARDLSAVAAAFGGGGHRLAVGYTSEVGPAETIRRLRQAVTAAAPAS
jgi:phosphoesterase RecJ-like protein